jgi:Cd2+/Zn2+-exporting ATPase
MIKRELILEGLNCAHCSAIIEHEVNELHGVAAYMNFITKTMTLEIQGEKGPESILQQVRDIVSKHEPDVVVKEKTKEAGGKCAMTLEGLGCAHCAGKIEEEVGGLEGVQLATLDFVSKKLRLETAAGVDAAALNRAVEGVVQRIEPNVKVVFEDKQSRAKAKTEESGESFNKKEIVKLIAGGALFAVGVAFDFTKQVELILFLASYLLVGAPVVLRAIKGVIRGQVFDENFLMAVATIGAFFIGDYAEGVAVMLFYLVGELFQFMAVDHSRRSISKLMDIRPDYANLKIGQELKKVSPEDVIIGDLIVVKPGERVPLDGIVMEGTSMVDTAALTGESVPRELEPGSSALSGFINKNSVLTVRVTKTFEESTVSKILDLVQNASSRKASTEKFISRFARVYTPFVVYTALALAVIPPLILADASFSDWLYRALVFLVVSCPCALVISIPLGFFGGIGGASKKGIMVKGSNYLEALNQVETVVFDKTGTLTKGVFKVTAIRPQDGFHTEELIEYAAYAESYSNHPIALSIAEAYEGSVDQGRIEHYEEIAGHGVQVRIAGRKVDVGNSKLMIKENIAYQDPDTLGTVVHIAIDHVYAGHIIISDEVKEDAAAAVRALKALGIGKTVMLTGDLKATGEKIGKELGLDEVHSELLPVDKVERLEYYEHHKTASGKIVFVGDGINDAPVLARADIGIAMGGLGSDAAIEAADIVIMTDEPSKIVTAIKIAKRTKTIVYQNIVFALGVKLLVLLMGAFGIATMWEAVFADVGVAVIAILNAMRVMNVKDI